MSTGRAGAPVSRDLVERWLLHRIAQVAQLPDDLVDDSLTFAELGLSSVDAVDLTADLGSAFGLRVDPLAVWDHPTPALLAAHLADGGGQPA